MMILTKQTIDNNAIRDSESCQDFAKRKAFEQERLLPYELVWLLYRKEITHRLYDFIRRHNLVSQVANEDAAGQR
jgi:hypothetical protein